MSDTDILALLGGKPINSKPRPVYNTIGAAEKAAVMAVLDSGELSGFVGQAGEFFWGGREVRALERAICARFGVKHAIAVNSATSALHAATHALCLEPGDEVIVSPYTMTASATAILFAGGVPIFADIEPDTFGLDPADVARRITPRTRAIMAVNIFGHPCHLGPLRELADRHGLKLIEDNAQAPASMYHNRYAGTVGHASILSFNRHKTVQSGEGGVLMTDDDDIAHRAAFLRNHGEVCAEDMGFADVTNTAGLNLRMTEMEAAVARVQFARLDELNAPRIRLADRLSANLRSIPGITPPKVEPACTHVYYMYCARMDEETIGIPRDLFARAVAAEGYYTRAGYLRPVYHEPLYQRRQFLGRNGFPFSAHSDPASLDYSIGSCPVVERIQSRELLLTNIVYAPHTEADMDRYAECFEKVVRNRDALLAWSRRKAA